MKKRISKIIKIAIKTVFASVFGLGVILLILYVSTYLTGFMYIEKNIEYQNNYLEYLKTEYYTDSYVPCDEQKLADFDIEKAYSDGVKLNEISVMGTHNSYQLLASLPKRALMRTLQIISFGKVENKAVFEMDTLTEQLEHGVRNLEIDIETVDDNGNVSFIVTHDPILDNVSSCYDFGKALEEIRLWSDHNPGHFPVYLLIEPKGEVPQKNNMQNFSVEYALELDKTIRNALGDKLLTPKLVMGDYASFEEMRENDSWPELKDCAGKIIVLLHDCSVTKSYINVDTSIRTQAMFPMLRFDSIDKPYTSFILENDPAAAVKNNKITVDEKKIMVRTRADDYPHFSEERYLMAESCGSHIISTDYPPRSVREKDHVFTLDGYTIRLKK